MPQYKCVKQCFAGRLYEVGEKVIADKPPSKHFVKVSNKSADPANPGLNAGSEGNSGQ